MTVSPVLKEEKRDDAFNFTPANLKKAKAHIAKYPKGRQASAVLPLLDLAQRQNGGWLPRNAMEAVANMLEMPVIRVFEVATFYTMFNLKPIGVHHVQVCTTTPCWLRKSSDILQACKKHLKVKVGETTTDGKFTLSEVECLGACVNAPMVQINDDFFEDLTAESMTEILKKISKGEKVTAGPQIDRHLSAPEGGATTLSVFLKDEDKKEGV
ncbi:MAG: NADH-quinone oxidoreductase subunit NuoE [Alphaproteobacteria bacterium]|jgi:NADH dehydrogenase (ubiquinone) flavoprotein 2|nr:NADH-quinone oxidoreductase subunit NuoE [Alphaproteobacteria bacterium]MBT5390517.1 NADH-quinone oxidoreductase subunit NuoE [Alphaproteobacteria bacterium]MBT5654874.1 NADH-quinone oxidoreductase subunit NuoE [Alphaproteobacteria bacterium]